MKIIFTLSLLTTLFSLLFVIYYSEIQDGIKKIKDSDIANTFFGQFINKRKERKFENDKIIIIVAYGRSGSSFTGSIFQEVTSSFYLYEPVRVLRYSLKRFRGENVTLSNFNSTPRQYNKAQMMQAYLDAINIWLHCNLSSFCIPSVMGKQSTPIKHGCCGQNRANNTCIQTEEIYCGKSPVKIMKFIRLRMRYLLQLLQIYPNMKVIHLVRDPRGIMNSRNIRWSLLTKLNVQKHCNILAEDLTYSKKIILQYPNRLLIVRYEDLAEHPIKTTMEMFQFAGLKFSNKVNIYLKTRTQADRDTGRFCLYRMNSSATAMKWRTKLDSYSAVFIYSACSISNEVLGYLALSSDSAMKNYTIPAKKLLDIRQELLSNKNF